MVSLGMYDVLSFSLPRILKVTLNVIYASRSLCKAL
nr:MAG TPA: hypothetical protein [Caudoviricetes sp.]